MKQLSKIILLLITIVACAILSVLYYPEITKDPYVNNISHDQFFLLVKNFVYDNQGIRKFYSFKGSTAATTKVPVFFAIKSCEGNSIQSKFQCYDYNINHISIEDKNLRGFSKCTSVDNLIEPKDALAHTVRIQDDVYKFHKNCFMTDEFANVVVSNGTTSSNSQTSEDVQGLLDGFSTQNDYEIHARLLANAIEDIRHAEYNKIYQITINDRKLNTFIVLARPLFIRVGSSALYKIIYDIVSNSSVQLTDVNMYISTNSSLIIKVKRVCDSKMYSSSLPNLTSAIKMLKEPQEKINCKETPDMLDFSSPFMSNYITRNETKTKAVIPKKMNIMMYYLTHSQYIESNEPNTSCISLFFKNINFYTEMSKLFEFNNLSIDAISNNNEYIISLNEFGVSTRTLSIPQSLNVHLLITWSDNRLNTAVFYTFQNDKHVTCINFETSTDCLLPKNTFNQACIGYQCALPSKNSTYVTMYDIAQANNLV